jgi:heme-degrading monooxygenase HmoA
MHAGFAELRRHCPMNLALRTKVELEPARRKELARFEQLIASARASHAERGAFLFGEFCAADAMLAPVATRIRSYGIEVNAVTQAWMDAVFTLPAFQRWEKEAESERAARPVAEAIGVPFSGSLQERIPAGPCYAVIFSSQLAERTQPTGKAHVTSNDTPITSAERSYEIVGERMVTLARASAGYLGHESTRDENGFGITVSYWSSLEAIAEWRSQSEHKLAQQLGRQDFYQSYNLRVARVEKHRVFSKTD